MTDFGLTNLIILPVLFGLFGFVEPCSIGSTLIVIKHLEGATEREKILQMALFAATRAIFIGLLGIVAVFVGSIFLDFQKGAWFVLGMIYLLLGGLYLTGKSGVVMRSIGPSMARLGARRGSVALGLLFGLNIPACAAPLLLILLGAAATEGAAGATALAGFISLALFGLALSLPLVVAVMFRRAQLALDKVAAMSERMPWVTGLVLIALGGWSLWFALFVTLEP